jgi:hypothetical protein
VVYIWHWYYSYIIPCNYVNLHCEFTLTLYIHPDAICMQGCKALRLKEWIYCCLAILTNYQSIPTILFLRIQFLWIAWCILYIAKHFLFKVCFQCTIFNPSLSAWIFKFSVDLAKPIELNVFTQSKKSFSIDVPRRQNITTLYMSCLIIPTFIKDILWW